jgi:hypothetical protein
LHAARAARAVLAPRRARAAPIKDFRVDQGQTVVDRRSKHSHSPLIDGIVLDRREEREEREKRA